MTSLAIFRLIAPEFVSMTDSDAGLWLTFAADFVAESYFGTQYAMALAYMAAHLAAMSSVSGSTGGARTAEGAGDLSVSYAVPAGADALSETAYGRMVEAMATRRPYAAGVLVSIL